MGLDLEELPKSLTEDYTKIVSLRLCINEKALSDDEYEGLLKIQDEDYEKATEVINHYKSGKLHVTMEIGKEEFIGKLEEEGYVLNLTLDDNCLYCSNTDTSYLINSFVIEKEMMFLTEEISETIRAVNSPEFNIKGYYIF